MSDYQDDQTFECPYCAHPNSLMVDPTGGDEQSFTLDCEICCRPIVVHVTIDDDGVAEINAEREL